MHFITLAATLLPALAAADFNIYYGSCDTGLGGAAGQFEHNVANTDGQEACGGCGITEDGGSLFAGNPCNPDSCTADTLEFVPNGSQLDIIVQNTGINVGYCEEGDSSYGSCNNWNYACLLDRRWRCITAYCT